MWVATPIAGTGLLYNQNFKPTVGSIPTLTTMPNGGASADIYVADASKASAGTLFITGADSEEQNLYLTSDKKTLFYTFSQLTTGDGGAIEPAKGDGLYVVAVPAAP